MLEDQYSAWIILVILTALSAVSIAFEKMREYLVESVSRLRRPIILSLFGELTVLGFIGIVIFVVVRTGVLSLISERLFGKEEEGEEDLLSQIAEDLHMILFAVMVLFLLFALGLTVIGRRVSNRWALLERRSQNPALVYRRLQEAHAKHAAQPWYSSGRRQLNNVKQLALYASLRERFTKTPRKSASYFSDWEGELSPSFNFAEYLSMCLSDLLSHLVEVPVTAWVLLEFMFIVVSLGLLVDDTYRPLMLLGLGLLPLPIARVMHARLNWILRQLRVPLPILERSSRLLHGGVFDEEESTALLSMMATANDTPPYLSRPLAQPGSKRAVGNRHEQLFWFGRYGKAVFVLFLRFALHIQATYVALIFVMAATGSLDVSQLFPEHYSARVLLAITLSAPPIIFAWMLQPIVETMVLVTSIEMMKNAENIRRVVREMKTRKALKALKLLITLQLDQEAVKSVAVFHPVDTSHIVLPESLRGLCEVITRASHMLWLNEQRAAGWQYGPAFNEKDKTHPGLVPYDQLDEAARARSKDVGTKFLRVVYALGFVIASRATTSLFVNGVQQQQQLMVCNGEMVHIVGSVPVGVEMTKSGVATITSSTSADAGNVGKRRASVSGDGPNSNRSAEKGDGASAQGGDSSTQAVLPINNSEIGRLLEQARGDRTQLSSEMSRLVDLLAADRHHTWAWNRMKLGWTPAHGDLQDSRLVPFEELDESHKAAYRASMEVLLRFLLLCGWSIREDQQLYHLAASKITVNSAEESSRGEPGAAGPTGKGGAAGTSAPRKSLGGPERHQEAESLSPGWRLTATPRWRRYSTTAADGDGDAFADGAGSKMGVRAGDSVSVGGYPVAGANGDVASSTYPPMAGSVGAVRGSTSGGGSIGGSRAGRRSVADDSSFCGIIPDEDEDDIKKTFRMFDPTHSGVVAKSNILFALQALGWAVDVTEGANIAIQMNPNPRSSAVTYQQFVRWIRCREAVRDRPPDMEHIIDEAFNQLDADESGYITAGELQDTMRRFGETLDSEDAEAIVREADRDGDGRINRREFAELMKGLLAHT